MHASWPSFSIMVNLPLPGKYTYTSIARRSSSLSSRVTLKDSVTEARGIGSLISLYSLVFILWVDFRVLRAPRTLLWYPRSLQPKQLLYWCHPRRHQQIQRKSQYFIDPKEAHCAYTNTMRARYKGPAGTGIIEMLDSATVQDVLDELRARTGIVSFTIKYGPPMAMKTLDLGQVSETARSIGLHGETLTIVPEEAPLAPDTTTQAASQPSESPEDINVPWPGREGTLCKTDDCNEHGLDTDWDQCFGSCPATTVVSSLHSAVPCRSRFQLNSSGG